MSTEARTIGAIALWLGAMLVGFYVSQENDTPVPIDSAAQTTAAVAAPVTSTTTGIPTTTAPITTTTTASTTTTTTTTPLQTDGAMVVATLENGQFMLSGVVPDLETKGSIEGAARTVYLGGFESSLEIAADAEAPEWFTSAPQAVTLLPIIGNGTITLAQQGAAVTGSAPSSQAAAVFVGALESVLGVDIANPAIDITSAGFPDFNARRLGDTITLTGTFANQAAQANIVDGAVAVYGASGVVDNTTLGDNLDLPYWTYTMPTVFHLLAPFPDYEIDISNGVTGGALNDGANFAVDSVELSDETEELLTIALAILSRDPTMGMQIAGHTDSSGSEDHNMKLSEARASAAAGWLTAAGIDAARIATVGYGEARPIASNDTEAGKASNRRVEFVFGPVGDIVGG